jgi:predicted  nucleic acid-binding Zn-ribbon protein
MKQDLALAVELQALDRKIGSFEKEIAALPVHIAEIEKKLEAHKRKLESDRVALAANLRDRKKFEGDILVHDQKVSKLKTQMLDAKTNDQYRAFQNEITFGETEIRKAEDKIIELMEQAEALEKNVAAADAALRVEQQHVDAEKKVAQDRTGVDLKAVTEAKAHRKTIVERIDPKLYTRYEIVKKKTRGTAIATVVDERCEGCMIALRPQYFQDLKAGEGFQLCETCGRILIYNPPVSFENDIAPAGQLA